jgi:hypothetical protein
VSLTTEYPLALIFICLLVAAGGSVLLYRNTKLDSTAKWVLWLLRAFRFLGIFLITFLLLGPLMKLIMRKVEKPFVVLAIDNSQSIVAGTDSAFYRREIPAMAGKIKEKLQGDFEVKTYTFGQKVAVADQFTFTEKQTDIAAVLDEIDNAYSNQNLGAVILATDGIYNEGSNPLYTAKALKAPLFAVALGDTNQHKDLLIKNVKHNQLVYQGNTFPLQVDVNAFGCSNQRVTLSVLHNEHPVFSKELFVTTQHFFTTIPVELDAKEPGMQHYVITLSRLDGEVTYANNRADVFVNVISGKQKIVLLALAPHPDLAAYRQTIGNNENFQVVLKYLDEFSPQDLSGCNLVILHQLPGGHGEGSAVIRQLHEKKIPLLYVLGSQTGLNTLNSLENTLNVITNRAAISDVLPVLNNSFALFSINEEEANAIKKFPPLQSPYGNYMLKGESSVLFRQQIGYVKTDFPLICFTKNGETKTGFICGEGFWKWRLYDAELTKQQVTQELMDKIVQYLAAKDDKRLFRISAAKKRFDENEPVQFDAEVYNESYELNNAPDVQMVIKNAQGRAFNYTFGKTDKAYALNAGMMPVGNYTYEASVNIGSRSEKLKGTFIVMPLQAEFLQTVADHQLLNQLALQSEGKLFHLDQTDELVKEIRQNGKIKPVIYKQEEIKSWINLKWICAILVILMSVEWFIRKWNGSI